MLIWKKLPLGSQQSISDETPRLLGQDPQNSSFLHSWSPSQSPSFTPQGSSIVQKSSSPWLAFIQQSVLESNPSEDGQPDIHLWPSRHWWSKSQSPSLWEHIFSEHAQKPISPTFTFAQSTEKLNESYKTMKTLLADF